MFIRFAAWVARWWDVAGGSRLADLHATGQGIVEYALILVLLAIVVIIILTLLGGQINNVFSIMTSAL